jgi:iron complex transport system permease protein
MWMERSERKKPRFVMMCPPATAYFDGPEFQAAQANNWMTGSIYGSNWGQVWVLLPWIALLHPLAVFLSRHLNVLQLEDEMAAGLGADLEQFISMGLTGFLCGRDWFRRLDRLPYGEMIKLGLNPYRRATLIMLADLLGRTPGRFVYCRHRGLLFPLFVV